MRVRLIVEVDLDGIDTIDHATREEVKTAISEVLIGGYMEGFKHDIADLSIVPVSVDFEGQNTSRPLLLDRRDNHGTQPLSRAQLGQNAR